MAAANTPEGEEQDIISTSDVKEGSSEEESKRKRLKRKLKKKERKMKGTNPEQDKVLDQEIETAESTGNAVEALSLAAQTIENLHSSKERGQGITDEDDDESDEDEESLLAAAAIWVKSKEGEDVTKDKNENKVEKQKYSSQRKNDEKLVKNWKMNRSIPLETQIQKDSLTNTPQPLSLHITMLPYSTSQDAIRRVFTNHGCIVSSVRLVYDHSTQKFKGVAFVDVADSKSFQKALTLDKMRWIEPESAEKVSKGKTNKKKLGDTGRRINVRPTKTKQELANIVQRTKEKLAEKRLLNQGDKNTMATAKTGRDEKSNKHTNQKRRKNDDTCKSPSKEISARKRIKIDSSNARSRNIKTKDNDGIAAAKGGKGHDPYKKKSTSNDHSISSKNKKLTKKERNKKAAILRSRQMQKKK